jgi:Fibronectin type III domain
VGSAVGGGLLTSSPASATSTLTLSPTTNVLVTPNSTVLLNGLSVSGDSTDQLQVTVATNLGTLSIATTTGLTLGYNNSWTGTASVTFNGLESAVDAGLASVSLVSGSTIGTATIGLTAMVAQSGFNYLASNQHFYEYVACAGCSWTTSDSSAQALSFEGQQGYLATIPNTTVNTFISSKIANATNVWFGARAYESIATDGTQAFATVSGTTYPRVWRWTEGANESPIAGGVISECTNLTGSCVFANSANFYTSWNSGEPNNSGGSTTVAYQGEYVAVTNWSGTSGSWNDLSPTNDSSVNGYVVEFGGKTNSNSALGTGFAGVVTTTSNVVVANAAAVPSAPSITGIAANASVNLSWIPPGDGGSAITGYQVSTNGGSTWSAITTTSTSNVVNGNVVITVSATPTGLTNGTAYTIEVEATNSVGNGAASNSVVVTPISVPGAPTSVSAVSQNGAASVSWTAPGNNGEVGIA